MSAKKSKKIKTTPSSVCRVNKNANYTVMSNYHLRSTNLSLKAIWLLSKVLSLPENWDYSISGLTAICKEKETAIKAITSVSSDGREMSLNKMWNRRQCTKFNGVPYVIQRAAEAVFSDEGIKEAKAMTDAYMQNARIISDTMEELGIRYTGGINSPYIWFECPFGMNSWDFFDYLLEKAGVVGTPGAGFGSSGDNWFRLTAFNSKENTVEAMERFRSLLKK